MSQYLHFQEEIPGRPRKTKLYSVLSKSSGFTLGTIHWNGGWRQYVFSPTLSGGTIWSAGCLDDVATFIRSLMDQRRKRP